MKIQSYLTVATIISVLFLTACNKDEHIPPSIEFKTGGIYTSVGGALAPGTMITVGIVADKKEDEMKTYNISYKYSDASSTTTAETFTLTGAEQEHYEKDFQFILGANAGTVTWYFVITDKDGNLAKKELTFTLTM